MKYARQFMIISAVTCVGEVIRYAVALPVPDSIYGLLLMLILLRLKLIKLEQVKETGLFLVEIMPVMFIPAAVGILESWELLSGMLLPACAAVFVTTSLVMLATGKTTDFFIGRQE